MDGLGNCLRRQGLSGLYAAVRSELRKDCFMAKYYEPMLFAGTSRHPNNMGMMAVLQEPVDGELLGEVAETLRERFPYFYVRAELSGNELIAVPNPLPITVRNTWEPTFLHSKEVNYHMTTFKYEGNAFAIEMSHVISDGSGAIPYFKSVLYLYLSRKTGIEFDPAGFRLPGDPISENETGDPFPSLDLDAIPEPFYTKKVTSGFYDIHAKLADKLKKGKNIFLKIPEEKVMEICQDSDGSPNVLLSVLLAKAVRRMDPESDKTVLIGVSINHKAVLGNYDSYHLLSDVVYLDFPKNRENESLEKMCTIARGQLMLQVQPENSMNYVKNMQSGADMLDILPLPLRSVMTDLALDFVSRGTACVSYPNLRSLGPLDPYIREIFYLSEPDAFDVQIEAACINGSFCLVFAQSFLSEVFFEAFCQELEAAGIPVEIIRKDSCPLSGVRFDGIEEEKQEKLKEFFKKVFQH